MTATLELPVTAASGPDGRYEEPSRRRRDKWPPYIRRQSWLIQDTITGKYFASDGKSWVARAEDAFSCLWFKLASQLVLNAGPAFPDPDRLRLVLVTFYCDPKTWPLGWFADE